MPALFEISSAAGRYTVEQEHGLLARSLPEMAGGVVIADEYFAARLAGQGLNLIALPATEQSKSLDAIGDVIIRMRGLGATRGSHLWAIGGGAIQDAAAFVASVYMRGIAWTYLPTTLLGMVDSCIGGKSSINVGAYKNIVGTFHVPRTVRIDAGLTASLSTEQRVAGLVEAAKITYCRGDDVFAQYLAQSPAPSLSPEAFGPIIALSLGAKKWFIEIDEFDRKERLLLNFGHTFGHALEGASHYRLSHGIGVGVGVLCALTLSRALLGGEPGGATAALEAHLRALLGAFDALPAILRDIDVAEAWDRLKADKKHEAAHYRFVTLDAAGRVELIRLPREPGTDRMVLSALHDTLASLIP
ncbi:3-dehydroquinate synthase [Roseomonas sp. GC11]|uniref:3-dehydroquinate synthase n=1 Tax=Roseomonas sp. GC11 TaxID=2950546 RepID=UPI00210E9F16|nr:3-dehydroquinate synthase family protein [Roseomonas sp. GC11]MCQ4159626.1 3-dehydroquinate synthase [Roseomonas sp. GC11]